MKQRQASKSMKSGSNLRTVFLGGIPIDTNKQELLDFLQIYDEVEYLDIAREKNSMACKGFAKAILKTEQGLQRLLSVGRHTIRGLEIGVKKWSKKSDYLREKDEVSRRKLYVRYHPSYTKDDLILHFSIFGYIESIDIKTDPWTNEQRNFAYVVFKTEEEARRAAQNSSIADKSQYILCELTTPSFLMPSDNRTTLCASPTLKHQFSPMSPTKQESSLSFEHSAGVRPKYGSMNNLCPRAHKASDSFGELNKNTNYCPGHYKGHVGSHQALFDIKEAPRKRNRATFNEFSGNGGSSLHGTKPTTKEFKWERVSSNHFDQNLCFSTNDQLATI